jgi:hypothetical protein
VTTLPPDVRAIVKRYREGEITREQRDAELTALANTMTRAAGLRNAAGVEHRMLGGRPQARGSRDPQPRPAARVARARVAPLTVSELKLKADGARRRAL